jgi:hypothetical protein
MGDFRLLLAWEGSRRGCYNGDSISITSASSSAKIFEPNDAARRVGGGTGLRKMAAHLFQAIGPEIRVFAAA